MPSATPSESSATPYQRSSFQATRQIPSLSTTSQLESIPVSDLQAQKRQVGYDRFVSFEWEKKCILTSHDANIALPHFTRWFRENCEL